MCAGTLAEAAGAVPNCLDLGKDLFQRAFAPSTGLAFASKVCPGYFASGLSPIGGTSNVSASSGMMTVCVDPLLGR